MPSWIGRILIGTIEVVLQILVTTLDVFNITFLESNNSPAYQNSAYTDTDAPTSSAPSSAYYSDLSVTTMPERAYEVVGLSTLPSWDPCGGGTAVEMRRPTARLAAISENVSSSVPSDYV